MRSVLEILTGMRFRFILIAIITALFAGFMVAESDVRPDTLQLRDAGSLTGHFVAQEGSVVVFSTLDAQVRLPQRRVESLDRSSEGESELYLGRQLLRRRSWDSAEGWLREAAKFPQWKQAAERALAEVEAGRQSKQEEQREAQRGELAKLIFQGNYEQGLRAIDMWSAEGEDIWAGERAHIHIILARNAVDHVEYRAADYHLEQARRAGATGPAWQRLRDEVDHWRRTGYAKVPGKTVTPFPRGLLSMVRGTVKSLSGDVDDELIGIAHKQAAAAGVDFLLVCAVIQAESAWNPSARSPKGAMGLMQLMPVTAREMGVSNPFDPVENIKGGTRYLRALLDRYKDMAENDDENRRLALGAYNAGPARIAKYNGLPPFKETHTYVQRVIELYRQMSAAAVAGTPS